MKNIFQVGKAWDYIAHRRMIAFWSVMAVMLPLPWIVPACTTMADNQSQYGNCRVLSVYDGDTMTVNCQGEKIKVRLYCIDAPEMGQEPWGVSARRALAEQLGLEIRLKVMSRDRYGRLVATLHSRGYNINLALVQNGHAVVYERYCHDNAFRNAERRAMNHGLGIWKKPGLHLKPWEWRDLERDATN